MHIALNSATLGYLYFYITLQDYFYFITIILLLWLLCACYTHTLSFIQIQNRKFWIISNNFNFHVRLLKLNQNRRKVFEAPINLFEVFYWQAIVSWKLFKIFLKLNFQLVLLKLYSNNTLTWIREFNSEMYSVLMYISSPEI